MKDNIQTSLATLQQGVVAIIKQMKLKKDMIKKLMFVGIHEGQQVIVLQKHGNGSIILEVNDHKVAIGKDLTDFVFVNYV